MSLQRANNYRFEDSHGQLRGTASFFADDGSAHGEFALGDLVSSELVTETSALGLLVSAVVRHDHDGDAVRVVAVLPRVNVADSSEAAPFEGIGMVVTHRSSIGGPSLVNGALELFDVRTVHGAADIVR
jgi:hypothetical protein